MTFEKRKKKAFHHIFYVKKNSLKWSKGLEHELSKRKHFTIWLANIVFVMMSRAFGT